MRHCQGSGEFLFRLYGIEFLEGLARITRRLSERNGIELTALFNSSSPPGGPRSGGVHAVPVGLGGDLGDARKWQIVGAVEEEDGHKIHAGMGVVPSHYFVRIRARLFEPGGLRDL